MPRKKNANPSAGARLPRRYMKNGRAVGNYYIRVDGKDVNLKTKDGTIAIERAKRARKGERGWSQDDGGGAAQAVAAALTGKGAETVPFVEPAAPAVSVSPGGVPPTPNGASPMHTAPPALPPIPQASPGPEGPADGKPGAHAADGEYIPPPPGWADQVSAAAGAASSGPSAEDEDFGDAITPDMIEQFLDDAAGWAVELQVQLQAKAAAKGWIVPKTKIKTSTVPEDAHGRAIGKKLWKKCFQQLAAKYMPDLEIPLWIGAPVLVAFFTVPVQLQGCTIIKDDKPGAPVPETPQGVQGVQDAQEAAA